MKTFPPALRLNTPVATLTGADDALAAINTSELADGCLCMVNSVDFLYQLRKTSTAAESLPAIVAPAQGGPGRWFRYGGAVTAPASMQVAVPAIPPQTTVQVTGIVPDKVAQADMVLVNIVSTLAAGVGLVGVFSAAGSNADFRFINTTGATVAGATVLLKSAVIPG